MFYAHYVNNKPVLDFLGNSDDEGFFSWTKIYKKDQIFHHVKHNLTLKIQWNQEDK